MKHCFCVAVLSLLPLHVNMRALPVHHLADALSARIAMTYRAAFAFLPTCREVGQATHVSRIL